MSVNSYLTDLAGALIIRDDEKEGINKSLDTMKMRLGAYFGASVTEKLAFGSYTRGTILPRKADEDSDIDLMVVFNNEYGYKPQTYLNKLKGFVEHYYSTSTIHQSSPSIVLEMQHIKFDLVPAYKAMSMYYYIPKNSTDWQFTDPNGFNENLNEANANNNYKLKRIIRLLKYWNIRKNFRGCTSFELENKLAQELKYAYFSCTSYSDYVLKAFEAVRFTVDYTRADEAKKTIRKALEHESDGYPHLALSEVEKVFPEL
jgi:predicted nucleotidyltransferase